MSTKKSSRAIWLWIGLAAAAALIAFLFLSPAVKDVLEVATEWALEVMTEYPVAGAVVFFVFSAVSAMLAFASSVVLVAPASEAWGKPLTFVLLWCGYLAGAAAAYGIGRLAHPLVARMGYAKKLEEYKAFASKRVKFWQVLLFCFAVPSEIPAYLFGGVHYPFWKFLAAIGIAEAVYALGTVLAGESLLEAEPGPLIAIAGTLAAILLAAGWLLRRQRGMKKG